MMIFVFHQINNKIIQETMEKTTNKFIKKKTSMLI